jgi:hypothetical protein
MLRYAYVCTSPAIYRYIYVNDTDANTSIVYVWYGTSSISAKSMQNSEFAKEHIWKLCIFQYRLHLSSLVVLTVVVAV